MTHGMRHDTWRELARMRHERAAGTLVDTRERLSTIVSYPCDDWEENVSEGRRTVILRSRGHDL